MVLELVLMLVVGRGRAVVRRKATDARLGRVLLGRGCGRAALLQKAARDRQEVSLALVAQPVMLTSKREAKMLG